MAFSPNSHRFRLLANDCYVQHSHFRGKRGATFSYLNCTYVAAVEAAAISIRDRAVTAHHSVHREGILVAATSPMSQIGWWMSQLHHSYACGSEIALNKWHCMHH